MADLRDYQTTALQRIRETIIGGINRLILQIPTGGGKTLIASAIVNGARGKRKTVVFTVPAISLIDQTVEMFYAEGIRDVGVIQANHHMTDWSMPIQIASVQTLVRKGFPQADVVIVDECHRVFKKIVDWMDDPQWKAIPFIGLSATPWTRGLGNHYGALIIGATTQELIDAGHLSTFRVYAPALKPDLSAVPISAGDYAEGELSKVMNAPPLTADAVETWIKHAENRPTICFAVDCAHARALQEKFTEAGVCAAYMDAETPLRERRTVQKEFEDGTVKVVCNVDIMGIGIDWPGISCISYCRPTRSEIRFVQNIGRGLRRCDGKHDLLILDHSDTTLRLGFVTQIAHDTLSNGKDRLQRTKQTPLPKECKQCHFLRPPGRGACPSCGHMPTPQEATAMALTASGELQEYTALPKYKGKSGEFTMEMKRQFYAELLGYAVERGWREGWASHKYRDKFGVWPNAMKNVTPISPAPKMRTWIRSRLMAYAKSKENGHAIDSARA